MSSVATWMDLETVILSEVSETEKDKYIVSGPTFRSLIHFEFIFMYDVREYSNFILLHVAVQFS